MITVILFFFFISLSLLLLVRVNHEFNLSDTMRVDYNKSKKNKRKKENFEEYEDPMSNKIKKASETCIVQKCFSKDELKSFNKYRKYAKRFLYEDDGIVKGEIWLTPSNRISELPQITMNGYYVNNLCVLKEFRKKGIGVKMMKWIIRKARREGKLHIILQVNDEKDYLVRFYRKIGFSTYVKGMDPNSKKVVEIMFLGL
jgi:ribosomal protein S18 acetylase RimI-like enzyme